MRYCALMILGGFLAAGCAAKQDQRHSGTAARGDDAFADARPAAAALVFEPPVVQDGPVPDLARDGRQAEAFVGYAEGVTEYFYVRWDDRQSNWGTGRHGGGGYDRFERRAVSEKVGALYR